jgi:adenosyl cobinamide kinase/adenosyl cobinamide phosphate guanylyltransferase
MLTFILGGARSGKSDLALKLAAANGRDVTFVATMRELDNEMRERVAAHRAARPGEWQTVEAPVELVEAVRRVPERGCVVIDCVTVWVANVLMDALPEPDDAPAEAVDRVSREITDGVGKLGRWAASFDGEVIVVSNDVGSGVVPAYQLGRVFRDVVGAANRVLAAEAERSYYVIAGMALDLRAMGARSIDEVADGAIEDDGA